MAEQKKNLTTKQWLYSVRVIERRKKSIVFEIVELKEEREAIYDTSHALFGDAAKAGVKPSRVSDPTLKKALDLCERLQKRLDDLLFEYERLDLESKQVRGEINHCFEEGYISVQEYEAIFYFYFEGKTNLEVAEIMCYSLDMVFKLKVSAIAKLSEFKRLQ